MRLSPDEKTIHITELISGITIALTAIFLILTGAELFPFSIDSCWLISIYVCFFVIALSLAILQKNHIGIFFVPIWFLLIISRIFVFLGCSEVVLYPFYVVAVPIGLIAVSAKTGAIKLLKCSIALTGAGLILFLQSTSVLSIKIVLPIIALYFGLLGTIYAVIRLHKRKNNSIQGDK